MIVENDPKRGFILIVRNNFTVLPAQEFIKKKWLIDIGFVYVETLGASPQGEIPVKHAQRLADLHQLMPRKFCEECGFDYRTEGV